MDRSGRTRESVRLRKATPNPFPTTPPITSVCSTPFPLLPSSLPKIPPISVALPISQLSIFQVQCTLHPPLPSSLGRLPEQPLRCTFASSGRPFLALITLIASNNLMTVSEDVTNVHGARLCYKCNNCGFTEESSEPCVFKISYKAESR